MKEIKFDVEKFWRGEMKLYFIGNMDLLDKKLNRVITQKCFYLNTILSIRTLKLKEINTPELFTLNDYLIRLNLSIDYFANFEGFVKLVKFDKYDININIFKKGLNVHFFNCLINQEKEVIIEIINEEEVKIMIWLFTYFFEDYKKVIVENEIDNFLNGTVISSFYRNGIYENIVVYTDNNCLRLKKFFEKFSALLDYIKIGPYAISESFIDGYIHIVTKKDVEKIDWIYSFSNDKKIIKFFFSDDNHINYFNGIVGLFEFDFVMNDNKRIKKYAIYFCKFIGTKFHINSYIFKLYEKTEVESIIKILKFFFIDNIEKKKYMDSYNFLMHFSEDLFDLKNSDILKNDNNFYIDKDSIKVIHVNDLDELMFSLEFYNLFL